MKQEYYWIRRNKSGLIQAAVVERLIPEKFLIEELREMANVGPIERILTTSEEVSFQLQKSMDSK